MGGGGGKRFPPTNSFIPPPPAIDACHACDRIWSESEPSELRETQPQLSMTHIHTHIAPSHGMYTHNMHAVTAQKYTRVPTDV